MKVRITRKDGTVSYADATYYSLDMAFNPQSNDNPVVKAEVVDTLRSLYPGMVEIPGRYLHKAFVSAEQFERMVRVFESTTVAALFIETVLEVTYEQAERIAEEILT